MFDGMLVADIETKRFFTANAAMVRMLGYSDAELRSLSVKDIHPQADLPFVLEQFEGLAEGKIQVSEDIPVLRKDGSVFYATVTSSKLFTMVAPASLASSATLPNASRHTKHWNENATPSGTCWKPATTNGD